MVLFSLSVGWWGVTSTHLSTKLDVTFKILLFELIVISLMYVHVSLTHMAKLTQSMRGCGSFEASLELEVLENIIIQAAA